MLLILLIYLFFYILILTPILTLVILMPRRKTIQPEPIERLNYDDLVIEVRNRETRLIGRGLHNRQGFEETLDKIIQFVSTDHFQRYSTKNPKSVLACVRPDYLRDASSFARKCELKGIPRDNSALRKRYYQAIIDWLTMVETALTIEFNSSLPPANRDSGIAALPYSPSY